MNSRSCILAAAVAALGLSGGAKASTIAKVWNDGAAQTGFIGTPGGGGYADYVNNTPPSDTYTSNLVNGTGYNGGDGSTTSAFTNGESTDPTTLNTSIFSFGGYINVPANDMVTFSVTSDDGGLWYIDGTPGVVASGTLVTSDGDNSHGGQNGTATITISGSHYIELDYFNQQYGGGNGGASLSATVTDASGAVAISQSVPEPASLGLVGLGILGMMARRRK